MKRDFANILSGLRHENNLSQKKAADELGISQALLSHYENGVREPKLEFVIKACDYYGVSADYILGRTLEKTFDGVTLKCKTENHRRSAAAAALMISVLTELGDEPLAEAAASYLNFSLFTILSALRSRRRLYEPLFDAASKTAEASYIANARRVASHAGVQKTLSDEALREKYPQQLDAMLDIEELINKAVSRLKQSGGD